MIKIPGDMNIHRFQIRRPISSQGGEVVSGLLERFNGRTSMISLHEPSFKCCSISDSTDAMAYTVPLSNHCDWTEAMLLTSLQSLRAGYFSSSLHNSVRLPSLAF